VLENASANIGGLDERVEAPAAAAAGAAQHVELEDAAKQRCPIKPPLARERWKSETLEDFLKGAACPGAP